MSFLSTHRKSIRHKRPRKYMTRKDYNPKKITLVKQLRRHFGLTENTKNHRCGHIAEITKSRRKKTIVITFKSRIEAVYFRDRLTFYYYETRPEDELPTGLGRLFLGHSSRRKQICVLHPKAKELLHYLSKDYLDEIRQHLIAAKI